ncbi:MAG: hypothetical protein GWM90_05220 [Gemmatimonadetes bacterium]|nr:hypothetical protein [Gemmatimonadota bacterium]NIQ53134.1 hypothetical protein [Gemmatimonadota bacterium]NIU73281.1 hypothetical protein [Gammaproteobacteria bacterium]NIX43540.1 hypothetical protein [Gemmatimonadota bacterium]NIY07722.1 hypothetical protein [Gemmatimonadota bacterium]
MKRALFSVLVLAFALPRVGAAQSETPVQFAERYFEAAHQADWDSVAALMHPDALVSLKAMFAPLVAADTTGEMALGLFALEGPAEFESATPGDIFASLMRQMTAMSPELAQIMSSARAQVIGTVREEGTDVRHVVYRLVMETQGIEVEKLQVISMRPWGDTWGAILTGEIKGLAAALAGRGG